MHKNEDVCPHCGYCKHCGRGGYQTNPYYPWYPYMHWIYGTGYTVPYNTTTADIPITITTGDVGTSSVSVNRCNHG